jgi:WD40 repeat protein
VFNYSQETQDIPAFQQLKAHNNERVLSLTFNPGTSQLYSTSKDKHVNVYKFNKLEDASSADGIFLPNQQSQYFLSKTTQQKEEDLNIIYQLCFHGGSKLVMLGFYGNYAYVWDKQENMQIMSVDTKGGNRPIKLRV